MNRNGQHYDFSSYYIQIDELFNTLCETQKSVGVEPTLEEAVFDPETNMKYRRFQKRSPEEEARYEKLKEESKVKTETVEQTVTLEPYKARPEDFLNERVPSGEYFRKELYNVKDDEENDLYICEFCSRLGYRQKYDPIICDNCNECADCADYQHEECSGCSYSRYREGRPYSDFLSLEDILTSDEIALLDKIRDRSYEKNRKCNAHGFHTNDY